MIAAVEAVTEKLGKIEVLRAEHAGTPQPKLEWENKGVMIEGALEAARRTREATLSDGGGRPSRGEAWNVFGKENN